MTSSNSQPTRLLAIAITATLALGMPATIAAQGGKQSRECTIEDVAIYEDRVVRSLIRDQSGRISPAGK